MSRGTDEQRYKYMHGGRYGDRDLYNIREEKYGRDSNLEDRSVRYRPGFSDVVEGNNYAGTGGEVYTTRGGAPPRGVRDVNRYSGPDPESDYGRAGRSGGDEVYRDRDLFTSYGPQGSPSGHGGLQGIDYNQHLSGGRHPGLTGEVYHPAQYSQTRVHHHHHRGAPISTSGYTTYEVPKSTTTYVSQPVSTYSSSRSSLPYEGSEGDYEVYREKYPSSSRTTTSSYAYSPSSPSYNRQEVRRGKTGRKKWTPLCDVGETEKYYVVRCEVPGVRKEKLSVQVEGKDLIIRGKRSKELWNSERSAPSTPGPVAVTQGHEHSSSSSSGKVISSSTTTTITKTDDSGLVKRDHEEVKTNEAGVTHGAQSHEQRKSDGTLARDGISWIGKERGGRGVFKRKIRLPERVEQSAVQATYKEGILEVLVKKSGNPVKKRANAVPIQHD